MKRVLVIISGDVQGVGFRAFIKRHAKELHLTGWVKNREDGSVEAVLEGEAEFIKKMIDHCYTGPDTAWVDDVKVTEEPYRDEFMEFTILK